ncbi:MAG TPA: hypothetical protein PKU92_09220, partial [Agitococcus sp.]|nr:hypothetical protein [Agitococcus sp.]
GKLLAPNGKPSKLNRYQWAQVRTDNFKQWFGDWENDTREEKGRYDIGGVVGVSAEANPRTGGNAEQMGRADSRVRLDGFGRGRALLDATTREPKVFFHGTKDDIEAFDLNHPNRKDIGWLGRGVYVASDARLANAYAKLKRGDGDENVMPVFVSVKNPYFATTQEKQSLKFATQAHADLVTQRAKERGHDGMVVQFPDGTIELVAFDPTQIKSATSNNGEFNPTNPDIRFSQKNNEQSLKPLNPVNTRNILDRLLGRFTPKADAMRDGAVLRVRVVKSFTDLPLAVQEEAKRQGSNGSDIKGVFHHNTFYAVADNLYSAQEVEQTFFHEVYGHYGIRQLFGDTLNAELNKLWQAIGDIDGMRTLAKQ